MLGCRRPTGASVAQVPEPRPESVRPPTGANVSPTYRAFTSCAINVCGLSVVCDGTLDQGRTMSTRADLGSCLVVGTGVDPVTSRFSGARSTN